VYAKYGFALLTVISSPLWDQLSVTRLLALIYKSIHGITMARCCEPFRVDRITNDLSFGKRKLPQSKFSIRWLNLENWFKLHC